jgi:glycosyltransferase involved in cell wall biosynthesis
MVFNLAQPVRSAPLFTIVMPCYRAGGTIGTAIASVLAQHEGDFELIVVDDGSPDDSAAIAAAAIGWDTRCRVLRQDNAGPSAARNAGVAAGRGQLVAFLDADDRWAPELLSAHRDHFLDQPELGVSFARARFYDTEFVVPGRCSAHMPSLDLGQILAENPLCCTSNLVVRRDLFNAIGGFDLSLTHAEDQEFVVHVLATTEFEVRGIDAELVHCRTSPSGLSSDLALMERGRNQMLDRARQYADPAQFVGAEIRSRALYARYLARRALRTGHPARVALAHLVTALRTDPSALFATETKRTLMIAAGIMAALVLPRWLIAPLIAP